MDAGRSGGCCTGLGGLSRPPASAAEPAAASAGSGGAAGWGASASGTGAAAASASPVSCTPCQQQPTPSAERRGNYTTTALHTGRLMPARVHQSDHVQNAVKCRKMCIFSDRSCHGPSDCKLRRCTLSQEAFERIVIRVHGQPASWDQESYHLLQMAHGVIQHTLFYTS